MVKATQQPPEETKLEAAFRDSLAKLDEYNIRHPRRLASLEPIPISQERAEELIRRQLNRRRKLNLGEIKNE